MTGGRSGFCCALLFETGGSYDGQGEFMATVTVTSEGRVTIPPEIRSLLGVKEGDRIDFEIQPDGTVVLKGRKRIPFEQLRGIAKTNRRRPATLREMDEGIARAVSEKYLRKERRSRSAR